MGLVGVTPYSEAKALRASGVASPSRFVAQSFASLPLSPAFSNASETAASRLSGLRLRLELPQLFESGVRRLGLGFDLRLGFEPFLVEGERIGDLFLSPHPILPVLSASP